MKANIIVEVSDLHVDDRYYGFDYTITLDGEIKKEGTYEGDYENGMTAKEWKKALIEDGIAIEYALEQLF